MKTAIVIMCLVLAPAGAMGLPMPPIIVVEYPDPPPEQPDAEQEDRLSKDAMFMGGATIFALATFGGLVNVVFKDNGKSPRKKLSFHLLILGVTLTALSAYGLMYAACCTSDGQAVLIISMAMMFVGGFMGLIAYADIISEWLKNRGPAPPRVSGQAGGSPFQ